MSGTSFALKHCEFHSNSLRSSLRSSLSLTAPTHSSQQHGGHARRGHARPRHQRVHRRSQEARLQKEADQVPQGLPRPRRRRRCRPRGVHRQDRHHERAPRHGRVQPDGRKRHGQAREAHEEELHAHRRPLQEGRQGECVVVCGGVSCGDSGFYPNPTPPPSPIVCRGRMEEAKSTTPR